MIGGILFSRVGIAGISALVLAATIGVSTLRINSLKADLSAARAALYVPNSKVTWKKTAETATASLKECQGKRDGLQADKEQLQADFRALEATHARRGAEVARLRAAAATARAQAESAASRLEAFVPAGNDVCARLLSVDEQIKGLIR